ncbi:MAG: sugar phosphate nucleotidyltransferase [Caldilineaceae bacterium]
MKAVVMAGGEGSRLRPLTVGRPKPMVPIVNKPVLGHILDLLSHHNINDVVITLQYMPTAIQDYFGDGSSLGMQLRYVVEESPLGTAGGVKNAARHLDDTFLVISGDALTDFDLQALLEFHRSSQAMATLALYSVPDPQQYGVVITDDAGQITQFLEKPDWRNVISDTVNTGIYVLEPDVFDYIPDEQSFDFSTDLFPRLMAEKLPLFGHVAEGYWCDIGDMSEYLRANSDMLSGLVKTFKPLGSQQWGGILAGTNVEIAPDAQIYGPVYLGNSVKIKGGVSIHGPTVIRDYTVIDNHSRVERSVMWRNTYVGEACELRGVIVGRQCSIKSGAVAYEGAVIGDSCVLEENCVIHADVKIWPNKEIETGAIVRRSIIWGSQGRRTLFSKFGVTGVVNVDLTPEYAAKLGAALSAALPADSYVAINRDVHRSSRMLKRALISGLAGGGVNVWDLATLPIPVARHFVRSDPATSAGIHVRLSPFDQRVVDIRFMNEEGLNQSRATERNIERIFHREDFRRAYFQDIGRIDYAPRPVERYVEDFLQRVDFDRIRNADYSLVVDYSHGSAADVLSKLLIRIGVDVLPLNAIIDETKLAILRYQFQNDLQRMSKIMGALAAHVGVKLDVGGEKLFVVDERGQVLDNLTASLLMTELALYANPGRAIVLPVTLPNAFATVAAWHDSPVIFARNDFRDIMEAATGPDVLLALDGTGQFLFPDFLPAADGLMATVRLLEYLALRGMKISEVTRYLPHFSLAHDRVPAPWEIKGALMRKLNQQFRGENVVTLDGFKICLKEDEWIHIGPNPDTPYVEISAEAKDAERATELVVEYSGQLRSIIDSIATKSNGGGSAVV